MLKVTFPDAILPGPTLETVTSLILIDTRLGLYHRFFAVHCKKSILLFLATG